METADRIFNHNKYSADLDERCAEERAIDDWLPITSSRRGRWWFSTVHNVTAIVGAGVLGLPYGMSELGWGAGAAVLAISWIVTLYSLWQMVEMHEIVPGKRFDRFHELGQHAFGEKLGLWIVMPQQLMCLVGVDIVYMITGGQCLRKFHDLVCQDCNDDIKLMHFILIFSSLHLLPCVIWLAIFKPRRFSFSWFANWFCIVFGVLLMVFGAIGGFRKIIFHAKTYKFYA